MNEAKKLSYDMFEKPIFSGDVVYVIVGKIAVIFIWALRITTALSSAG
jgi:hypothetical protein